MSTPNSVNRADFMRDEGTAIFNELGDRILAPYYAVNLSELIKEPISMLFLPPTDPVTTAEEILTSVRNDTSNHMLVRRECHQTFPHITFSRRILGKLSGHTYQDSPARLMDEAISTLHAFPLGLIRFANQQAQNSPQDLPPVYKTPDDLVNIYRAEWFHTACETAAFTSNGTWGLLSLGSTHLWLSEPHQRPYMDLDLSVDNGRTVFQFSDVAVSMLRQKVAQRNKAAHRLGHQKEDNAVGSTSGCPVEHSRPGFRLDNPTDTMRLQALADAMHTTPEAIMKPRDKTLIAVGLTHIAGLLERSFEYIDDYVKRETQRADVSSIGLAALPAILEK